MCAPALEIQGVPLREVSVSLTVFRGLAAISDLRAELFGGPLTGSATLSLSKSERFQGELHLRGLELSRLTTLLPAAWSHLLIPGSVSASAQFRGSLHPWSFKTDYRVDGEMLGGKLSIEGKLPPPPIGSVSRNDGRLRLEHVSLSRLWQTLHLRHRLGQVHGVLTVDLPFRHEGPTLSPIGQGRVEIRDLRYQGDELAESVRADLRLTAEGVFLRDVSAELAGGVLRASLSYRFRDPSRNWFSLSLSRVESSRLLVFEEFKDAMQGPIDLNMRGSLGAEWRGSGSVEMSRGKVLGVEVAEWRVPVDFTFSPGMARGEWLVRDSSAQVGHGRAQLTATLNWSDHLRVEGSVRFIDASLRSLAGILADVSSYAQGKVSGRLDFAGGEVRSLKDLTATAQATLQDAQTLQLPIFNLIVPYLLPGQGGATFRSGEVHARLSNGIWRLSQMTLENNIVHLIIQGTLTVQGRLDLEVTGRTTTLGGLNPLLLRVLLSRIPLVGPVPVGLLFQATELLSNRLIRLRITGTTKAPRCKSRRSRCSARRRRGFS